MWSANQTDDVITFPIVVPDEAIVKSDINALDHLSIIKSTQENWVLSGTTEANKKPITHNVSCTVQVAEEEWDQVTNYLYVNRGFFGAVSLIPADGDKKYDQAPVESVVSEEDMRLHKTLAANMKAVDYTTLIEEEDVTDHSVEAACAGGACLF